MNQVASDPGFSPPFSDQNQAQIYAMYELCSASDAGGLVSYFMSEAAWCFDDALAWLKSHEVEHEWVDVVHEIFGGKVPRETDLRVDRLSSSQVWSKGADPLEMAQVQFNRIRRQIDEVMNRNLATWGL
jgi:hypothetical protein